MAQKTLHSRFSKRIICRPGLTKHTHTRSHTRTQSARVWLKIGKSSTWQDMNHFSLLVPATVGQKPGVRVPFHTNMHTHTNSHTKKCSPDAYSIHMPEQQQSKGGEGSRGLHVPFFVCEKGLKRRRWNIPNFGHCLAGERVKVDCNDINDHNVAWKRKRVGRGGGRFRPVAWIISIKCKWRTNVRQIIW